jgi:hypothetical protein
VNTSQKSHEINICIHQCIYIYVGTINFTASPIGSFDSERGMYGNTSVGVEERTVQHSRDFLDVQNHFRARTDGRAKRISVTSFKNRIKRIPQEWLRARQQNLLCMNAASTTKDDVEVI